MHRQAMSRRKINTSLVAPDLATLNDDDPSPVPFDYDMSISQYYAYAAARRPAESTMPRSAWSKLTASERSIWDKLSDETKAIILRAKCSSPATENGEHEENGEQSEYAEQRISFAADVQDNSPAQKAEQKLLAFASDLDPVEFASLPTDTKKAVIDRLVHSAAINKWNLHPAQPGYMMSKSLGKPPEKYKPPSKSAS